MLDYESFSSKRGRTLYQRGVTDWSVSLASFCVSVLELVFWVKITPPEPMYWYHEEKLCLAATPLQRSRNFSKKEKQRELLILLFILEFITP
ncbi:hypothetical protein [Candidatus Coxiella mudrowiae]|uniref:hypothetical protein n=1 Tax=Candidatus Coxiella mudrowiae TaxID=2054173 RepID=UPI00138E3F6C|nr:hypothetical protein [Candidatus Coxiella mudrowiae]